MKHRQFIMNLVLLYKCSINFSVTSCFMRAHSGWLPWLPRQIYSAPVSPAETHSEERSPKRDMFLDYYITFGHCREEEVEDGF